MSRAIAPTKLNWFLILQSIAGTSKWENRADLRSLLLSIQEGAHEALHCLMRDHVGTFSFRQCSEALKELETSFAALQKLKAELSHP